jgi:xylitol oxidase
MPHFRLDAVPSGGDELQTEYFVPRRHATAALRAVYGLHERIAPLLWVSEIRAIAADDLWMSPCCGEDCIAIHFTWKPRWEDVRVLLPVLEEELAPFRAKPHWGKLFSISPARLRDLYDHMPNFRSLLEEFDPGEKFRNRFLSRNIFGEHYN